MRHMVLVLRLVTTLLLGIEEELLDASLGSQAGLLVTLIVHMSAFHFHLLNTMKRQLSTVLTFSLFGVACGLGLLASLYVIPSLGRLLKGEAGVGKEKNSL